VPILTGREEVKRPVRAFVESSKISQRGVIFVRDRKSSKNGVKTYSMRLRNGT
jgi:hypothetical protein